MDLENIQTYVELRREYHNRKRSYSAWLESDLNASDIIEKRDELNAINQRIRELRSRIRVEYSDKERTEYKEVCEKIKEITKIDVVCLDIPLIELNRIYGVWNRDCSDDCGSGMDSSIFKVKGRPFSRYMDMCIEIYEIWFDIADIVIDYESKMINEGVIDGLDHGVLTNKGDLTNDFIIEDYKA